MLSFLDHIRAQDDARDVALAPRLPSATSCRGIEVRLVPKARCEPHRWRYRSCHAEQRDPTARSVQPPGGVLMALSASSPNSTRKVRFFPV